ncbi:MAG: hypothetical protein AVDCRST_MAG73-2476, partial [uncultured Thermomicrobiales bacterium]
VRRGRGAPPRADDDWCPRSCRHRRAPDRPRAPVLRRRQASDPDRRWREPGRARLARYRLDRTEGRHRRLSCALSPPRARARRSIEPGDPDTGDLGAAYLRRVRLV